MRFSVVIVGLRDDGRQAKNKASFLGSITTLADDRALKPCLPRAR
jgi:hypothetical protein